MAASAAKLEPKLILEIRTKSVEQTLVPLVTQITTLVNHKERAGRSERTLKALMRVGQTVNFAVERFVGVGETIAAENGDIRQSMCAACKEARAAGGRIQKLTDLSVPITPGRPQSAAEKTAMVRAARQLLSAITKVLILADRVVIKQLVSSKQQVSKSLTRIENVSSFTEFVKAFSQFGNEMVELAHLSGDRQNDLKNEKARAMMGSARCCLERSTMMLLTTSKTVLRHPECESARRNRDGVFGQMRDALDRIQSVITGGADDGASSTSPGAGGGGINGDSGIGLAPGAGGVGGGGATAFSVERQFQDMIDVTRVTFVGPETEARLRGGLNAVVETTHDFTDSAYTSHENREKILALCERLQRELLLLLQVGVCLSQKKNATPNQKLETAILKTRAASRTLRKQLQETTMDQASDVFVTNADDELLGAMKTAALADDAPRMNQLLAKFYEHSEQLQEVCKLLRHIAGTEPLAVWAQHMENMLKALAPQVAHSTKTLGQYSCSKIAKENVDVFNDAWASQINDLSVLVKDVNDACQGKTDRQVYLSLPRPGRHGTTMKTIKPVKLNAEEQAKIAKLGLEMKLLTCEMDAETDKWTEPDTEVVRRARNMSSMAFSMYLFTRGEGPLRTTQDLFTQAQYFAEEGNKLYACVRDFLQHVPHGDHRTDLASVLDRIPTACHQLGFTIKSPTIGKTATFNKVDNVIQETKNLMNIVAKVVTTCFICTTKYNIDYRGVPQSAVAQWLPLAELNGDDGALSPAAAAAAGGGCGRSESMREPSAQDRRQQTFQRTASLTRPTAAYGFDRF